VDDHSYTASGKTWKKCRWDCPIYNARYPSDQELFGSAEEADVGAEILDKPDQIMVGGIGNCHCSVETGLLKPVYF
jgi:hypothetical protein